MDIYIYGLQCHISNSTHNVFEARNISVQKVVTLVAAIKIFYIYSVYYFMAKKKKKNQSVTNNTLAPELDHHRQTVFCTQTEISMEIIFHMPLYSRLTMNREIFKRFTGLQSSEG